MKKQASRHFLNWMRTTIFGLVVKQFQKDYLSPAGAKTELGKNNVHCIFYEYYVACNSLHEFTNKQWTQCTEVLSLIIIFVFFSRHKQYRAGF